jgi:hypothetical protein
LAFLVEGVVEGHNLGLRWIPEKLAYWAPGSPPGFVLSSKVKTLAAELRGVGLADSGNAFSSVFQCK